MGRPGDREGELPSLLPERQVMVNLGFVIQCKRFSSGPMLSISRNVRLSVCLSVCLFTFEVPFKRLFAPTSQSRMSNIF